MHSRNKRRIYYSCFYLTSIFHARKDIDQRRKKTIHSDAVTDDDNDNDNSFFLSMTFGSSFLRYFSLRIRKETTPLKTQSFVIPFPIQIYVNV